MNLTFTEEHEELRATVRQFFTDKSDETAVHEQMASERGWDPDVWKQMAEEIGLAGLIVPESHGGAGFGPVELCLVMEEMGRKLACSPFLASSVAATQALLTCSDDATKQALLPTLATGDTLATLATSENGRWDLEGIAMTARKKDGGWLLDGRKGYVLDGHNADVVLVAARIEGGLGLFRVDADASGLTRRPLPELDLTRKLADLDFAATPATLVSEGDQTEGLEQVLAFVVAALAAEQVGGA